MEILKQALNKINTKNKRQKDFFIILIQGLIGIAGKRTFRNLARYMQITEYTFSMTNWARKYHVEIIINRMIDMFGFDQTLLKLHPNFDNMLEFANVTH